MIPYTAPVDDMRFVLERLVGLDGPEGLSALPGHEDATAELVGQILDEAAKLAGDVLAPLNMVGDKHGATLDDGVVRLPAGFREAYAHYRDGGWNALPFDPEHGGQGLPWAVAFAVQEMWQAANMAFGLCPLLNQGAVELLQAHGSPEQKATWLPDLIAGSWTGTMNLTEPQAGSDLGALRTRAERAEDGRYRITGQKIYITYGEHDLADNIVHMVLARLPDAPAGSRGISLFIVPKYLPEGWGAPAGTRNDLRCVSLEHKLGIHASPTCTMAFGDDGGAIGELVGEENRGLEYMFTMMNNARLSVGLQGVAIAERAYQQARDYARDRVQGKAVGAPRDAAAGPILHHPDVRRMLAETRARIEAARALTYLAAAALDRSHAHPEAETRHAARATAEILTPVVKAWATDLGVEAASLGIQVHGGMGYVEETGAAQHLRDSRIAPIYEGTNGIQANDLVFRKVLRDGGEAARLLIGELRAVDAELAAGASAEAGAMRTRLASGLDALSTATDRLIARGSNDPAAAAAAAYPYLELWGTVAGGWALARSLVAAERAEAEDGASPFLTAKKATARIYAETALTRAPGLLDRVVDGPDAVLALDDAAL
ncbi:MAG: acyl-CoA dehydrogenase [Azospirillaceae bacterium]